MLSVLCPGAHTLLGELLSSWNPTALTQEWKMPDGYDVYIPVMAESDDRIKVDELGGASFTFHFSENKPVEFSLSTPAKYIG